MTDSLFNVPLERVETLQLQLSHLNTLAELIGNQAEDVSADHEGIALILGDLSKHIDGTLSSLQSWLTDMDATHTLIKKAPPEDEGHD